MSKAAAAKRYERLMKAHGITNNGNGAGPSGPVTPAGKGKAKVKGKIPASQTPKKRKLDEAVEDDDEEGIDEPSKAEAPKAEKETKVEPTYSDGSCLLMCSNGHKAGTDDEFLLVAKEGAHRLTPISLACVQQMFLPPPAGSFNGFSSNSSSNMHIAAETIPSIPTRR